QPYWTQREPVEIDRRSYVGLDSDKRILSQHHSVDRHNAVHLAQHALDVDALFNNLPEGCVDSVSRRLDVSRPDQELVRQLPVCLHWYRKCIETTPLEEKLLFSWVVLERAFASSRHDQDPKWSLTGSKDVGRFRSIIQYIPVHEAITFMYDVG